ncbi:MAG: type II toxin-antitoxin system VapC family toxin [Spirochaetaceae bacterium]|nr:type II toxin-antitoxin system VapC family toxin [Spirochaetaceae bacterium]
MKPYYLLDTNIISELMKATPNKNVVEKAAEYESLCAIPSTTWNELLFGVQRMAEGKKKSLIFEDLIDDIQTSFPIIHYDNHAAWIHADIRARLADEGTPIDFQDTQIASIAISNNMVLVTRNTKHFEPIQKISPLMIENWFD